MNNSQLARKANITPVYLGEILKKRKNPPDKKTQYALAEALGLNDGERCMLFDLAARERNEIPVDVYDYIVINSDVINEIRRRIKKGIE